MGYYQFYKSEITMNGKLITSISFFVLLFTVNGYGQDTWKKLMGGSRVDKGISITNLPDDTFIISGYTTSSHITFSFT